MSWLQIKLTIAGEFADELSDCCLELGALSAVIDNAGADVLADAVLEPGPGETIVWERAVITAFWNVADDIQAASLALNQKLHDMGLFAEIEVNFVAKDGFPAAPAQPVAELSFGDGRLWLVPRDVTAERREALADAALLMLDPGLAFGSGLHPTTQLCLDYLARLDGLSGARVLDFGCGSGVLALGALALKAAQAHAVDHDPQALVATLDNAAYNGLAEGMQAFMPSELPTGARYEVVVANILANPLIDLAGLISDRLLPGGRLVLAGLLAHQADQVMQAYSHIRFEMPLSYQGGAIAPARQAAATVVTGAHAQSMLPAEGVGQLPIGGQVTNPTEDWVRLEGVKIS